MITRIVKLTFKEDKKDDFIEIWNSSRVLIQANPGCNFVEMMQSSEPENVFFTYSIWDSEDDLNAYRRSELFGKVWKKTKALFDDKPQAWTTKSHGFEGKLNKNPDEKD